MAVVGGRGAPPPHGTMRSRRPSGYDRHLDRDSGDEPSASDHMGLSHQLSRGATRHDPAEHCRSPDAKRRTMELTGEAIASPVDRDGGTPITFPQSEHLVRNEERSAARTASEARRVQTNRGVPVEAVGVWLRQPPNRGV